MSDPDILTINHGIITAPAGCGKTQLIADALYRNNDSKPVLVLTHTNAGVVALRRRLDLRGVPANTYRLSTIDGWAMKLGLMFPTRSSLKNEILNLSNPGTDYPNIRVAAINLLKNLHIEDIIKASYSRLIVDEYQDCSIRQHLIAAYTATSLPTCVLGDPLQAIFGFGADQLAKWEDDICSHFPIQGELLTPWRWINAKTEDLGQWLLEARHNLLQGETIDLRSAPDEVTWVDISTNIHEQRLMAAKIRVQEKEDRVLIISDSKSPATQQKIARSTPGAVTVEAVDLRDLVSFAKKFDLEVLDNTKQLILLLEFAHDVMTGIDVAAFSRRIQSLHGGTARKKATTEEQIALDFFHNPSYQLAGNLLGKLSDQKGTRTHRPTILSSCIKALKSCEESVIGFSEAVIRIREQNRIVGRPLPRRAVGSTLLLKGLESEVVVVLNADDLNARNLYVAMTRGSKKLIICSKKPTLNPGA